MKLESRLKTPESRFLAFAILLIDSKSLFINLSSKSVNKNVPIAKDSRHDTYQSGYSNITNCKMTAME